MKGQEYVHPPMYRAVPGWIESEDYILCVECSIIADCGEGDVCEPCTSRNLALLSCPLIQLQEEREFGRAVDRMYAILEAQEGPDYTSPSFDHSAPRHCCSICLNAPPSDHSVAETTSEV